MDDFIKKNLGAEIKKINTTLDNALDEAQVDKLVEYLRLLYKWNQAYNLTAIREPEEMIRKHVIDSLSVLPKLHRDFLEKKMLKPSLADIGSGAGLPGIPLAIARPDWQITLIDSNGKKTGFLSAVKRELGLGNISVINTRVEAINEIFFDAIICRAFSSLEDMVKLTENLWTEKTCLWAMKGKYPTEELRQLPKSYRVSATYALELPQETKAERHLLQIVRHSVT